MRTGKRRNTRTARRGRVGGKRNDEGSKKEREEGSQEKISNNIVTESKPTRIKH